MFPTSTADECIVMRGVSWETFEGLLDAKGDDRQPKVTYLEGVLELMSKSFSHGDIAAALGDILNEYFAYLGVDFREAGTWTIMNKEKRAGLEPDNCYILGTEEKPRPDLAIEVVWRHGGIDKLEVYRRLGIGEVWFWIEGKLSIHVLTDHGYEERDRSAFAPDLAREQIYQLLELRGRELVIACRRAFPIPLTDQG